MNTWIFCYKQKLPVFFKKHNHFKWLNSNYFQCVFINNIKINFSNSHEDDKCKSTTTIKQNGDGKKLVHNDIIANKRCNFNANCTQHLGNDKALGL